MSVNKSNTKMASNSSSKPWNDNGSFLYPDLYPMIIAKIILNYRLTIIRPDNKSHLTSHITGTHNFKFIYT